jgi:ribose transport system substrate-binding protein
MKRSVVLSAAAGAVALLAVAGCSSSGSSSNSSSSAATSSSSAASSADSSAASSSAGSSAASSGASSSGASSEAVPTGPSKANKNYNISFIQGVQGDEFYITMECGIKEEAAKLGVTVNTQGPQKFDPTLQRPILDSVVASKPDAILIAPTDVQALQTPLAAAAAAGIKIVLVDTTTNDPSFAVSQVSSDNVGGGAAAFTALKQLVPAGGPVMVENVNPGVSTTDQRQQGFEDAVKADSSFKYLGSQYSKDDPATAAQQVQAQLSANPDMVGVFAANLFAAEGAATGVKQAGKGDQVKIVGFDAGPNQVKDLEAGTVQALVAQQPATIGKAGLDQAVLALDGGQTTPKIQTGFTVITKDTVASSDAVYKSSC